MQVFPYQKFYARMLLNYLKDNILFIIQVTVQFVSWLWTVHEQHSSISIDSELSNISILASPEKILSDT